MSNIGIFLHTRTTSKEPRCKEICKILDFSLDVTIHNEYKYIKQTNERKLYNGA